MSGIPSNLTRVPNMLASRLSMGTLARTNVELLRVQQQIASGIAISRPSDDIVKSAAIATLDDRLERIGQVRRNLSHADAALGVLDSLLGEAHTLGLNGKSIASEQLNASSSDAERSAQAVVVDQLIQSLFNTANRQSVAGFALGGSRPSRAPIEAFLGGYRYVGSGSGLMTDLGMASGVPITLGPGNPLTDLSARVRGTIDLDPALTGDTRLADLNGARGTGIAPGNIRVTIDGGDPIDIDLAGADTVQDVVTRVDAAVRQYEADNGPVLDAGGVGFTGGSLSIDVASGHTLAFSDAGGGATARDLGLATEVPFVFDDTRTSGADLDPRLTLRTPVAALAGLTGALGQIKLTNAGRSAVVDLTGAATVGEIANRLRASGLGVRVTINDAGSGIDVRNEVAAGSAGALSISEVSGQGLTATQLGIRTLGADTRLADFNFGRGVSIVDGEIPPEDSPNAPVNTDFRITLGDSSGTVIDVDLRPQDMATVQTMLDRVNAEAAAQLAAVGLPPGSFSASIGDGDNGIVLTQDASFTGAMRVDKRNNSLAAEQLGLLNATRSADGASLIAQDRATVRVDSLFTNLIDLRDALRANDVRGIALAGSDMDGSVAGLAETRGLVGGYGQRVDQQLERENARALLDEKARSEMRDTDFTSAASRLALLQTQLQAGLQVAALSGSRTLLDYLS